MQFPHIVFRFPSQSQHGCPFLYPSFPPYLSSWFTPVPSHCPHGFNPVPRHIGHRTFFSPAPAVAASPPLLLLRTNPTPPSLLPLGKTCRRFSSARRRREEEEEEEEQEEIEKERDGVVVFSAWRMNICLRLRACGYERVRASVCTTPNCVMPQIRIPKTVTVRGENNNPLHTK